MAGEAAMRAEAEDGVADGVQLGQRQASLRRREGRGRHRQDDTRRQQVAEPSAHLAPHQRSEEHTSELQSRQYLVCRLLLEKKKTTSLLADISLPSCCYLLRLL